MTTTMSIVERPAVSAYSLVAPRRPSTSGNLLGVTRVPLSLDVRVGDLSERLQGGRRDTGR